MLEEVCRLIAEAGKAILQHYELPPKVTMKGDNSPLTEADLASHHVLCPALQRILDVPVVSEEGDVTYRGWKHYWLVDPLDGTRDFLARNGEFCINVALMSEGRPILAAIHAPVEAKTYVAEAGLGAYRLENGGLHRLRGPAADFPATLVSSRHHQTPAEVEFADRHGITSRIRIGSALKFVALAEGRATLYLRHAPCREWDTAAGDLILREVGGEVIDLATGGRLQYGKPNLLNGPFLARAIQTQR